MDTQKINIPGIQITATLKVWTDILFGEPRWKKFKRVIVLANTGSFRNLNEIRIWVRTRKNWREITVILSPTLSEMEIQINQMNPDFRHSMNRMKLFMLSYVYTKGTHSLHTQVFYWGTFVHKWKFFSFCVGVAMRGFLNPADLGQVSFMSTYRLPARCKLI